MTIRPITPPPGANWSEWFLLRDAEVRAAYLKAMQEHREKTRADPYEECPVCDQPMYGPDDFL